MHSGTSIGARARAGWLLALASTALLVGCRDVRNGVVTSVQNATESALNDLSESGPTGVLQRGLASTLTTAFFQQFINQATP